MRHVGDEVLLQTIELAEPLAHEVEVAGEALHLGRSLGLDAEREVAARELAGPALQPSHRGRDRSRHDQRQERRQPDRGHGRAPGQVAGATRSRGADLGLVPHLRARDLEERGQLLAQPVRHVEAGLGLEVGGAFAPQPQQPVGGLALGHRQRQAVERRQVALDRRAHAQALLEVARVLEQQVLLRVLAHLADRAHELEPERERLDVDGGEIGGGLHQLVDDRELEQAGESDQRHQDQRAARDPGGERHVR